VGLVRFCRSKLLGHALSQLGFVISLASAPEASSTFTAQRGALFFVALSRATVALPGESGDPRYRKIRVFFDCRKNPFQIRA
jgi:hypothetical protein